MISFAQSQRELKTWVETLVGEQIAPLAEETEAVQTFPRKSRQAFAASGLNALAMPASLGGRDASVTTLALVLKTVAEAFPFRSLLVFHHHAAMRTTAKTATPAQKDRHFPEPAAGNEAGACNQALKHAGQATENGRPPLRNQAVAFGLAEARKRLEAVWSFVFRARAMLDGGDPGRGELDAFVYKAKCFASAIGMKVVELAGNVLGRAFWGNRGHGRPPLASRRGHTDFRLLRPGAAAHNGPRPVRGPTVAAQFKGSLLCLLIV